MGKVNLRGKNLPWNFGLMSHVFRCCLFIWLSKKWWLSIGRPMHLFYFLFDKKKLWAVIILFLLSSWWWTEIICPTILGAHKKVHWFICIKPVVGYKGKIILSVIIHSLSTNHDIRKKEVKSKWFEKPWPYWYCLKIKILALYLWKFI